MEFSIKTKKKEEIIDITDKVKEIVFDSNVKDGICLVFVPHATAAIMVNENNDPSVSEDILSALNKIIPEKANYKHDITDNNAASHIKALIIGCSKAIPIKKGILALGIWQAIALAEFDGPKERKINISLIGEK